MAVLQVQDANGKNITVDDSKISYFTGDVIDSSPMPTGRYEKVNHAITFQDSAGNSVDPALILKDLKDEGSDIIAIDVQAESTHSGKNANYCVYHEDSMEKDVETFMSPYKKPMLKNHDSYGGEPLGRITRAWFGPSALTDERSAIHTVTRVTDRDAMEKFLDGRYQTVSIGGYMGTVTCSICGKTILKDGKFKFCGHWHGSTYKNEVCYWHATDIEYYEHSVVNSPADPYAQVVNIKVIKSTDASEDTSSGTNSADNRKGGTIMDENQRKMVIGIIDGLLGGSGAVPVQQPQSAPAPQVRDSQQQAPVTDNAGSDNKKLEDMKAEKEQAEQKAKDAEAARDKALEDQKKAEKERDDAVKDAQAFKDQCVQLAESVKSVLADHIMYMEKTEDSKKEERRKELIAMSMKELQEHKDSIEKENAQPQNAGPAQDQAQPQRQQAHVQSPVLSNEDSNAESGNPADAQDSSSTLNIDDYADKLIERLMAKH